MLSIEKCYEILNEKNNGGKYSKEEAKTIREVLMELAEVTFQTFNTKQKNESEKSQE